MKSKVAEAIRILAGIEPTMFIVGVASDIQARTCTVTPVDGSAKIEGVRLNANTSGDKGMIIKPKSNTQVVVAMISQVDAIIIDRDEVESIDITVGATTVSIKDGEILLNGGDNGGLIIISDLVSKINAIEDDINSLKQVFSTWVSVPQDGGAALKVAAATWFAQQIVNTTAADIKNDKIKH
jgi:hypothetical protein